MPMCVCVCGTNLGGMGPQSVVQQLMRMFPWLYGLVALSPLFPDHEPLICHGGDGEASRYPATFHPNPPEENASSRLHWWSGWRRPGTCGSPTGPKWTRRRRNRSQAPLRWRTVSRSTLRRSHSSQPGELGGYLPDMERISGGTLLQGKQQPSSSLSP